MSPSYCSCFIIRKLGAQGNELPCATRRKSLTKAAILSRALRFGICNLDVLERIERHYADLSQSKTPAGLDEHPIPQPPQVLLKPTITGSETSILPHHPRSMVEIPKRLFRSLPSTCPPSSTWGLASSFATQDTFDITSLPMLTHLLVVLKANPDSHGGYPLAKAVLARHLPLITLLLGHGADPDIKESMSVMLAIGRNDLEVVKMLIERDHDAFEQNASQPPEYSEDIPDESSSGKKRSWPSLSPIRHKRRRLEDRLPIRSAMLELAVRQHCQPIIAYFRAKGAVPNLKTLGLLERQ